LAQREVAQPAHLLDEQLLDLIGGLQRALGIAYDLQDALDPNHHLRMLTELLDQLDFLWSELAPVCNFLFHPHSI
jgi:hypothetical protein